MHNMIETLNGTHETVSYKDMQAVRAFLNTDPENFPLHWHTAMEIIAPVRNEYTVKTNGKTQVFYPGDIILIPPGELHALYAPAEGERLILQFDYSLLATLGGMDSLIHILRPYRLIRKEETPELASCLGKLLAEITQVYMGDDPFREPDVYSMLLRFFVLLGRAEVVEAQKFPELPGSKQQEYIEKFMDICNYINEHCTQQLRIEDLAKRAGFSKYHFSRLFKQFTGVSCYEYLTSRRLAYAEKLLLCPDLTIMEVAMRSGFNSLSTFNRIFKAKKACAPSRYKSLNNGILLEAIPSEHTQE